MKIVEVQWYPYRLPFLNSFTTAHGVTTAREGIIVQITTEDGIVGIGEIAPLPEFGIGAQFIAPILSLLPTLAEGLRHAAPHHPRASASAAPTDRTSLRSSEESAAFGATLALCGLEMALLDAIGKAEGCGVSTLLSPIGTIPRANLPVNAVIGAIITEAAVASALEAKRSGFCCIKLKVGWGASAREEIERIAAVRAAIGPAIHLRLDANEAWNREEAIFMLSRCVPYDIQYVEQPLKAHDLAGMHALRHAVPIPIAADEALHSLESAQLVLDNEAADILVIKPQLAGGLYVAQQIIQAAAERGVQCVITSTIESGIGLTAVLHLAAASPAITLECGLATLPLLVDDLIMNSLPVYNGLLAVPTGPGLGVALDWQALHTYELSQ